jgi:Holliday junction DNA helicase RuvA
VIGWLKGRVVDVRGAVVVLDVGGVGYQITTVAGARRGEPREFFVHTVLRTDALLLYGFDTAEERDLFELLNGTPGIGPSTALAALRTLPLEELRRALDEGDTKALSRVPGIGPKTASRIVLELRGRLVSPERPTIPDSVLEALRGLGYSSGEIGDAVGGLEWPDDEAAALRLALARMAR